jgi:cell division protein FtsZ
MSPAPAQPVQASAPVHAAPVQAAPAQPAPQAAAPSATPRSSLFSETPAAQPSQSVQEPRIIARIVDPSVEDEDTPAPAQHTAPPRQNSYAQPQPTRLNTEEEGRESFWRGLFPQRHAAPQAAPQTAPQAPAEPVRDEADRYVPAPAKGNASPATRAEVQPTMETEDDLEIPSFLRRLAN